MQTSRSIARLLVPDLSLPAWCLLLPIAVTEVVADGECHERQQGLNHKFHQVRSLLERRVGAPEEDERPAKARAYTPLKMIRTHCAMASEARCSKPTIGSIFHSEWAISSFRLSFAGPGPSFGGVSLIGL